MSSFFELRLYRVARGRSAAMRARWEGPLVPLFARHGVSPCGAWLSVDTDGYPLLVYLIPWASLEQRSAAWAGFYGDPEWLQVRTATNAGSELVERYWLNFLQAVVPPCTPEPACALAELWLPAVAIGQNLAARTWLTNRAAAELAPRGGTLLAAFECLTGDDLPRAAVFVGWHSATARAAMQWPATAPWGPGRRLLLEALTVGITPLVAPSR